MEMQLDLKGLNKECTCGSKKLAGFCCKKEEKCPCGSEKKAKDCCFKAPTETKAN
jgi:hypothetical protein